MPAGPGPNSISANALSALGSRDRSLVNALNTPGGNPLDAFRSSENAFVSLLNPSQTTPTSHATTTTPNLPSASGGAPSAAAPAPAAAVSQLSGFANQNMTPAEQSLMQAQLTAGPNATGPFASTVQSGGRFYTVPLGGFPSYDTPDAANRRYKQLSDWLNGAVAR